MNVNSLLPPLINMLTGNGQISVPQTAALLSTSEESILEALEILVYCFDTVDTRLEFSKTNARLYSNRSPHTLRLNESETAAFVEALKKFGIDENNELMKTLIEAKGYFENPSALQEKISTAQKASEENLIKLLACACEDIEHPLVELEYQSASQSCAKKRIIEPHTIISKNGYSYLRCFLHDSGQQRSFRFDRIKNVQILDERFSVRTWQKEKQISYLAHVLFKAGANIPEWPEGKIVEENADGSKIMEIRWLGGMWLPKQIVAQFGCAKVLDPPKLKEAALAYAEKLLEQC